MIRLIAVFWAIAAGQVLVMAAAEAEGQAESGAGAAGAAGLTVVTTASHCDWAWAHSRAWHAERYTRIIREVLLLMRKYPHYVWQLENVNEELTPFLEQARREWPGLEEEFWQRVREGRIEVIVGISNPRLCEVYPETTIRNIVLGKQYFRRQAPGLRQDVYHAVDLMVGHAQMPQILQQTGYRYFMFSRPQAKRLVFWRRGLDGTRMLYTAQHYADSGLSANGVTLVSQSNDDILPSEDLARAAETWDREKKVLAWSARFFEEVEKAGGELPELEGALDSLESFTCGTGLFGNQNLYTWNNQDEDLLLSVEKAQAMVSCTGKQYPAEKMDGLWRDLLSCVGHAILWSWKADYEERLEKSRATRAAGQAALEEALAEVVKGIGFKAVGPLVVFNFNGWAVTGPVQFTLEGEVEGLALRDGAGTVMPSQTVGWEEGGRARLAFIAKDVPGCGYKTYYLVRGAAGSGTAAVESTKGAGAIENQRFRIETVADGRMTVRDKASKRTIGADAGGLGAVVLYDVPIMRDWIMNGPFKARHDWEIQPESVEMGRGPVLSYVRARGRIGPHEIQREVRLWEGLGRIEFDVDIEAAEGCGVFHIRFPLEGQGQVWAGIPFGAEPRENLDGEPFRGEVFALGQPESYYATRWTDVSNEDHGYTLIAPHGVHNGYTYRRQEQALELALLRIRPMPAGLWNQVHPLIQGVGRHSWRLTLVPHGGSWREAATYRDALESHVPLMAFGPGLGVGRGRVGTAQVPDGARRKDVFSLVEVKPANMMLSAVRCVEPDQPGGPATWELRLYETAGDATEAVVRMGCSMDRVQTTNLLGETDGNAQAIRVEDNQVCLRIPPWKMVTLRMTAKADSR